MGERSEAGCPGHALIQGPCARATIAGGISTSAAVIRGRLSVTDGPGRPSGQRDWEVSDNPVFGGPQKPTETLGIVSGSLAWSTVIPESRF